MLQQPKIDKKFILSFWLLFLFFGCSKRTSQFNQKKLVSCTQQEAKLTDIPIPLGSKQLKTGITENSYAYRTNWKMKELVVFYEKEMEREGWAKKYSFNEFEGLLAFDKPNRIAFISIRQNQITHSNVYIFFKNK
jgi:hypothetical protein